MRFGNYQILVLNYSDTKIAKQIILTNTINLIFNHFMVFNGYLMATSNIQLPFF